MTYDLILEAFKQQTVVFACIPDKTAATAVTVIAGLIKSVHSDQSVTIHALYGEEYLIGAFHVFPHPANAGEHAATYLLSRLGVGSQGRQS